MDKISFKLQWWEKQRKEEFNLITGSRSNVVKNPKHLWKREKDWKISALCGYGRYCHEGNKKFARSCKGRNCECWCHKKYLVEEKSVPLKYSWTSDIRDQIDDVVCLIKTT